MTAERYTEEPNECGIESESEGSLTRAAGFLDVSEYRVLEIAYPFWFGREPEEATIVRAFDEYLDRGVIPFWARSFLRSLRQETDERGCSVQIIEARPPDLTVRQKAFGVALLLSLLVLITVFSLIISRYPSY